jgi:D-alanyl-D-alanine dipeptidase
MISHVSRLFRLPLALCYLITVSALPVSAPLKAQTAAITSDRIPPGPKPPDAPLQWKEFLGIYGTGKDAVIILERDEKLYLSSEKEARPPLLLESGSGLKNSTNSLQLNDCLSIRRDGQGTPYLLSCLSSRQPLARTDAGSDQTHFYHVTPLRSVEELRERALKLSPPTEAGPFRKADLVELATLDPAIHLDIRYATAKNFLSTPVYTQARAFMQRPGAEALVRVLHKLQPLGYGLLIHDAYRPWYVTKIFWDATPPEGKIFVANPKEGSKHNRGCAVDLTLYDLATGHAVEMPGLYDEMSPRSFPNFPGGTSLQRWHRDLLRRAMESEGFTVNQDEWWHFDYKDWKRYGILNVPFEKLGISHQPTDGSRKP